MLITLLLVFLMGTTAAAAQDDNFGDPGRSVTDGFDNLESDEDADDTETRTDEDREEDREAEMPVGGGQNLFWMTGQLILGLAVVLFLIYAVLKVVNKRARSFSSHRTLQSVGGVGIAQNRSVQMVRVGDRLLVLGVGETVSLLKEIEDPEEIEQMIRQEESGPDMTKTKEVIQQLLSRKKQKDNPYNSRFGDVLSQEMDGVKHSQEKLHSELEGDRR
ncbi:flagellar biosynthetic protein FliO [Alkalicoccus chagannorensis]|uniref:flagellar biosynthetic protein FliO n=1 Tax=Alkalicoccus chagannorensis TaxID=427072 RepID=UPI00047C698E|nr:flagellar biosynthetic protein FliO [Alkalicoccus chagannorensis]